MFYYARIIFDRFEPGCIRTQQRRIRFSENNFRFKPYTHGIGAR